MELTEIKWGKGLAVELKKMQTLRLRTQTQSQESRVSTEWINGCVTLYI